MNIPAKYQDIMIRLHAGTSFAELKSDERELALTGTSIHVVDNLYAVINAPNGPECIEWARRLPEDERLKIAKDAWASETLNEPMTVAGATCLMLAQMATAKYMIDVFSRRSAH